MRAALEQLRELTQVFPDYALAYSGMAAAGGFLSLFGVVSGRDVYPEVKANAERGYALDPYSGETCTILGGLRGWFQHRWDGTFKLYDRALELQPGYAPAHFFLGMALLCQRNIPTAEAALRRSTDFNTWILCPPATAHGWPTFTTLKAIIDRLLSTSKNPLTWTAIIRKHYFTRDCCTSSSKIMMPPSNAFALRGFRWKCAC